MGLEGPGPGRPKGSLNKTTRAVKEALEEAFEELGGVPSLVQWARRDPHGFYTIWGKMLPKDMTVTGKDGEPIRIVVVTGVPDPEPKGGDGPDHPA
jgi:hypothetical protein